MKRLKLKLLGNWLLFTTGVRLRLMKIKCLRSIVYTVLVGTILSTLLLPYAAFAGSALSGAGATFPYPLYSKWFYEYNKQTGIEINYQAIGSGGGIRQIIAKTVDFGASDAPLNSKLLNKHKLIQMPTVAGAEAIAYNIPGIKKGLKFTPKLLADIYLGKITNWGNPRIKAVNPDVKLPSLPIIVVHRADGSGTTYIFTSYLSRVSSEWAKKVGYSTSVDWPVGIGGKGNAGVAGFVIKTRGSIGYVELAYVLQNNMAYGLMKNKAGYFVWPSIKTAKAAAATVRRIPSNFKVVFVNAPGRNSYPIAGFTYLIIYKNQTNPAKAKMLLDFINWAYTKGEAMAKSLEYVPLPADIIAKVKRQLKKVTIKK